MKAMMYLDANVFIYPHTGQGVKSDASIVLLAKVALGELEAGTSVLSWDEVQHALRRKIPKEQALEVSKNMLFMNNLLWFEADAALLEKAQFLTETCNLQPRDAIHAATAILNGCREIISDDPDFDRVKELKRVAP